MMKKFYTILLLIALIKGYAQEENKSLKVFPSSPDTYNLGTYGNINIGEYTGTMMQDIPLHEYSIGDIKVPVSLKYSSNGIKVDDYTPIAGLGWTLNANGIISRIIRGEEDPLEGAAWQKDDTVDPATGYKGLQLNFYENIIMLHNYDTEKDLYRVNIPGIFSTSFVQHGANNWIQEKKSDFKIQKTTEGFLITSHQGIKYYFTLIESSENRVQGDGWSPSNFLEESAYFITQIEDTKNNTVFFEYEPEDFGYISNKNDVYNFFENHYYINCTTAGGIPFAGIAGMKQTSNVVRYNSYRLKRIRNNVNQNILEFNYTGFGALEGNRSVFLKEVKNLNASSVIETYKLDYLVTTNNRVFLRQIHSETTGKQYQFEYLNPELLPKRLSNAQDFWGYYNGAIQNSHLIGKVDHPHLSLINFSFANREINTNLSSSGLLSKIIYPTKGYSKVFYEPHTEWGTKVIPAIPKYKYLTILTNEDTWDDTVTTNFYSGKSQKIKFSGGAQFNQDCSAMTHQVRVYIKIKNLSTGQNVQLSELTTLGYLSVTNPYFYPGGRNEYYLDTDPSVEYQVSLSVSRPCFGGGVSFKYIDAPDTVYDTNLPLGGNRVERIEHYDNVSLSPQIEKWYYAHKNQLNKSSGISPFKPVLWKYTNGVHYCPPSDQPGGNSLFYKYTPYRYVSIFSNSLIPLFGNESQNVSYEYITKSLGGINFEKGGKFTEYIAGNDPIASNIFGNGDYRGGNFTNSKWNKGLVRSTQDLTLKNGILTPIKEITNEYYYNSGKKEEFLNFTGIKYGSPQMIAKKTYKCTAADITRQNTGYNPCYGQQVDYPIPYLSPLDLSMFGEVLQYKFISHDYYLSKVTTKENFANGTAKTTVEYLNNNPNHYQTTSQKTILPDLSINETLYSYAHEKNNPLLISENMVGMPLETITTQTIGNNTKILNKTEAIYPVNQTEANTKTSGLVLPTSVLSYDIQNPNVASTEVTYDRYDSKGNLLQYTTKDGISTVIIWGYNQTQPIAKIEGAKLSDIQQPLIDSIVNASNTDALAGVNNDETSLLSALNTFRNSLSGYPVTTYTYDPLVGVRSITPPSGIRESYMYDAAGRLEKVIDANGKVLKEMKYNYKN